MKSRKWQIKKKETQKERKKNKVDINKDKVSNVQREKDWVASAWTSIASKFILSYWWDRLVRSGCANHIKKTSVCTYLLFCRFQSSSLSTDIEAVAAAAVLLTSCLGQNTFNVKKGVWGDQMAARICETQ